MLSLVPSTVDATCFCMMRPAPSTVSQGVGITADPSYNPASAVFLARRGNRTVLTIEAAYQGPPGEISVVIPVPQSIPRSQVRTVSGGLFRTLDRRTAPIVKHVWPSCRRPQLRARSASAGAANGLDDLGGGGEVEQVEARYSIDIEDQWEVAEYDITMLGAEQSTGLLRYLIDQGLQLPPNADGVLRTYIETGHRFILAKVDPSRARRLGEMMMLSPIQLEYESDQLVVPVRLGTLNSPGEQELLLYVLSSEGRYELANRPNVVAPTDLRLAESAAGSLAELYSSLMTETFRRTPGAAVTEFAHTLGSRVWRQHVEELGLGALTRGEDNRPRFTLTRIRHRYGKELSDDLVLRAAGTPLRMTRRWQHPELRTWAPRAESGFHVQLVVEHRGSRCPSTDEQRRLARSWATAESMWGQGASVWPGRVLLDSVPELGISARSEPPAGWPPPSAPAAPAAPTVPVKPEPATPVITPPTQAVIPTPAVPPTAPSPVYIAPPAPPVDDGLCTAGGRASAPWLVVAALVAFRRSRRH